WPAKVTASPFSRRLITVTASARRSTRTQPETPSADLDRRQWPAALDARGPRSRYRRLLGHHLSRRRCLAARPVRLAYPRRRREGAVATRGRRRAAFRAARDRGAHPTRARDRQAESDGRGIEPALAPAERRRYSSNAVSADRQRPTNGGKPSGATRPLGHLLLRPSRDVPRRLCSGGRPARRHIGQVVTGIGFEIIARDGAARLGRLSTAHGVVD